MSIVIQGALISGLYALIAVGFTMVYGVGRVENLAHGAFIMVCAYVFYFVRDMAGMPEWVGFLAAIGTGIGLSLATYKGLVKRFRGNPTAVFISTIILALVLQYVVTVILTPAPRNLLAFIPGITYVLGTSVTLDLLMSMGVSWACLISLLIFIKKTHIGRAIRAISEDVRGAIISGIDVEKANLITWTWAGALAAVAGIFFAGYTHLIPGLWVFPLVMAFAIVIVGGIGSIEGSIVAAYIIGFSETAMTMMISEKLRGVFGMAIMIGILLVRPRGLFGKEM
jgi:branched-chain amino acid transport system permease protein